MTIELLLFVNDELSAESAACFGVDGVVVDLEVRGKSVRQHGFDTQISANVADDVAVLRRRTALPMTVRLNGPTPAVGELDLVLAGGADEVLVPMVRTAGEVAAVIDRVRDRAAVSCMVETRAALDCLGQLAALPVRRFYIGLNDLQIELGTAGIFEALVDGTVERIVDSLHPAPVGVAGLTHPGGGRPLPCRSILDELVRLGASFTFLRRSFIADLARWAGPAMVDAIRAAVTASAGRAPERRRRDHDELVDTVRAMTMSTAST